MKKVFITIAIFICFIPFLSYAEEIVEPIKILLVPGHNNKIWGAQYGNMKEADMNLALATEIYNLLKKDNRFDVYITRDKDGFVKEFADYFLEKRQDIISFKSNAQEETKNKINEGKLIKKKGVEHVVVSRETSVELYGINKWANENNIDAMINVHFNDYNRPSKWTIGKYMGFAIYMPDEQMVNATKSIGLAKNIFDQLIKKYVTSTYEKEKGGLVPDDSLIALGASGTLNENVSSVLIEYGYIYRKIFRDYITRHQAYKDMAQLTVDGIVNQFYKTN